MLSVYTRHYPPCSRIDIHYRRCRCPKWIRGMLEGEGFLRFSAKTRNWAEAELKARKMEQAATENSAGPAVTVEDALAGYVGDQTARNLSPASLNQSKSFLQRQFLPWCQACGLFRVNQIRTPQVREFRHSWKISSITAARRHERLRAFFVFCISNGWLQINPMDGLKRPVVPQAVPTDYFNRAEVRRIISAAHEYDYGGGTDCRHRGQRLRALVLLMRWSGLSIKDAVTLERRRMDDQGALFLRRAKTGVPVFVPLPPAVVSSLRALPSANHAYFFWSGNGDARSAVQGYERSFRKLFRIADIREPDGARKRCRSHMFRDTFAVELLLAGVPIDQVSVLLGHRSVKMTERHYLPWVKARQKQLTTSVQRAWFPEVRQNILNRLPF
jgi:integrase